MLSATVAIASDLTGFEPISNLIADSSVVWFEKKYLSPGGGIDQSKRKRLESNPVSKSV